MDIFRATQDFDPPSGSIGVLPLHEGDFFDVLDSEESRQHKEWWGVRRTGDNVVGFVFSKYIKFEETRPEDVLPDNYQEQREMYVRQLHDLEKNSNPNVAADIYRSPPTYTRNIDEWCNIDPNDPAAGVKPDYSDSDDEGSIEEGHCNGSRPNSKRNSRRTDSGSALTEEEWAKIVNSAEDGSEDDLDVPEPDYQDDEDGEKGEDTRPYKFKVMLPHEEIGASLGGDGSGSGEIKPKKLVNPVLQSATHLQLHKEMLMNKKRGVDVLHKKSEFRKEFESRQIRMAQKEKEKEKQASKNPFQLKLDEQAEKIKKYEIEQKSPTEKSPTLKSPTLKSPTELKPAKSPTSPKSPKTLPKPGSTDQNQNLSEFQRVHSKIKRATISS